MAAKDNFNLTESQERAIEELRKRVDVNRDVYKKMDKTFLLYRFLKARNWDVNKAENMLKKTIENQKKFGVDLLIHYYQPPEVLQKYFSNFLIGYDKVGCLVLYVALGKSEPRGLHKATKPFEIDRAISRLFINYEYIMEQKMKELNQWLPGVTLIFDMEGLTFATATNKKGIELLIRLAVSQQDNAPERLKSVYFINVSPFFTVPYNIVKAFLSSETQKKYHAFGRDGYQEELLKVIDADQLPAFMGGTRTDPDGNPRCKTFLNQMGPVDESYYLTKNGNPLENSPGVERIQLLRASATKVPIEIKEPGSVIEWEFETKSGDIGFGILYKEPDAQVEEMTEEKIMERVDTKDYVEHGMHKCEKAGEYFVLFDNSYSWFQAKEIFYRLKVIKPNELERRINKA